MVSGSQHFRFGYYEFTSLCCSFKLLSNSIHKKADDQFRSTPIFVSMRFGWFCHNVNLSFTQSKNNTSLYVCQVTCQVPYGRRYVSYGENSLVPSVPKNIVVGTGNRDQDEIPITFMQSSNVNFTLSVGYSLYNTAHPPPKKCYQFNIFLTSCKLGICFSEKMSRVALYALISAVLTSRIWQVKLFNRRISLISKSFNVHLSKVFTVGNVYIVGSNSCKRPIIMS